MDPSFEYRPIRGRARFAQIGVTINVVSVFLFASVFLAQAVVNGVPIDQLSPDDPSLLPFALAQLGAGLGVIGSLLLAAVAVLVWLHRAVANAHAKGRALSFSPGKAVGMWFVPFANLLVPYQMMGELDRQLEQSDADDAVLHTSTDITIWWALFVMGGFVSWFADPDRFGLWAGGGASLLAATVRLGSAVCLFRIINRITNRLEGERPPSRF